MTNEQINMAIAEACGWSFDCDLGVCWDQYGNAIITPPNYCADLNAMHEAEYATLQGLENVYTNMLARVTGADDSCELRFFCATAQHRA